VDSAANNHEGQSLRKRKQNKTEKKYRSNVAEYMITTEDKNDLQ